MRLDEAVAVKVGAEDAVAVYVGATQVWPVGGGAFDPITDVGWAHAYWAEGPEFVAAGYTNGSAISPWPDEVGSADVANGTSTERPALVTASDIGTQPAVRSDGGDRLTLAAASFTALTQPNTVVLVAKYNSASGDRHLFDGVHPNRHLVGLSGTAWFAFAGAFGLTAGTFDQSPHLITAFFDNTTGAIEIDGTVIDSGGGCGTQSLDGLNFFSDTNGSAKSSAEIAFLGIHNSDARSDPGWGDFEQWVEDHYGITVA